MHKKDAKEFSSTDDDQEMLALKTDIPHPEEEEAVQKIDREVQRTESIEGFPDMSLAAIPTETMKELYHPRHRRYWFDDELRVDKMISWI